MGSEDEAVFFWRKVCLEAGFVNKRGLRRNHNIYSSFDGRSITRWGGVVHKLLIFQYIQIDKCSRGGRCRWSKKGKMK